MPGMAVSDAVVTLSGAELPDKVNPAFLPAPMPQEGQFSFTGQAMHGLARVTPRVGR